LPVLTALTDSVEAALWHGLSLALIASLLVLYVRRRERMLALVIGGASIYGALGSRTLEAALLNGSATLLLTIAGGWLVVKVLRHDVVAYVVILFTLFMVQHGLSLIRFSAPWYAASGWVILGLGLLPVVLSLLADHQGYIWGGQT
jgi:hypothetical protein